VQQYAFEPFLMHGPEIIARTLSQRNNVADKRGNKWQYFSRSDHHSKTVCWAFLFDLLQHCRLLNDHVSRGLVGFGINHKMTDFTQKKAKDLDLVISRPAAERGRDKSFADLASEYKIALTREELRVLSKLPRLERVPVGSVLIALEAKAAMTSHVKALPRLYDELNSSHSIVHGDTQVAIAAGLVLVNFADTFVSPDSNKIDLSIHKPTVSVHKQPHDTQRTLDTILELPRRSNSSESGFDGIAAVVVDCVNDGRPVSLVKKSPAPAPGEILHYDSLVGRMSHLYQSRFPQV
jgi:hypothetical protein